MTQLNSPREGPYCKHRRRGVDVATPAILNMNCLPQATNSFRVEVLAEYLLGQWIELPCSYGVFTL